MTTKDLTGQRFGRLAAVSLFASGPRTRWSCACDCGKSKVVRAGHLLAGKIRSCGCLQAESRFTHNLKHGFNRKGNRQSEYRSWVCMRERCNNPKNNEFHRYGARGIKVCKRWSESFEAFLCDMGRKPTPKHSIDRFPNKNGNYAPGNCRWATATEQARNARSNKIVAAFGQSKILAVWVEEYSADYGLVQQRISRGWSAERALTIPPDQTRVRKAA